ncbi:MAG: hypothetical protein U0326_21895 [Polyangiales bacterium]
MLRHTALALVFALPLACGADPTGTGPVDDGGVTPVDGSTPTDGSTPADGATGYTEALCADTASLADLSAAYVDSPAGIRAAAHGIAERRYPIGVAVIDVQSDAQLGGWFRQHGAFSNILDSFEVAVHEGGHIWDLTMIRADWPYRVRDDLVIRTRRLTNFNRSEILTLHADPSADSYDEVYLTGSSGAQGFNTLLDEYVQYTHSLAARYCTRDGLRAGSSTSARDGILTMMYYVELYLKKARTDHPADYAAIVGDPEHVRLIRTVWQRAEFWLNVTASNRQLGIRDAAIRAWTYAPENVMEIERLPR